jgi:Patatin-like phospholipase
MSTDGGIDEGVDKGVRILSLGERLIWSQGKVNVSDGAIIDGGGPGTYSQLLMIKEYTVRLASDLGIDEKDVYPADYFDLMGGVGFGGYVVLYTEIVSYHPCRLVAILLGHLRMTVDEAIEALLDVAAATFPDDSPNFGHETRTRQLSESVKSILQARGIAPDMKMQDTDENSARCKVYVLSPHACLRITFFRALYAATTADLSHPIVLRNYKPRIPSLNPSIVEAICATMASPSYFSPVKIGPHRRQQTFIGGPRGANNPTRELLKEASALFGNDKMVVQIVSLGCGRSHISSVEITTNTEGVGRSVQEMAADCEAVAKELSMRLCDVEAYLRLNMDRGMDNVLMNKWDDLGPIETHTSAYVQTAEISQMLEASLRRLQGSTGTITLGEISAYRDDPSVLLLKLQLLIDVRSFKGHQGRAGQAR